mgnify:FL=1
MDVAALRIESIKFRRVASNFLNSTMDDCDVNLERLFNYIETSTYVQEIVHGVVDNVDFDFRSCFPSHASDWLEMSIPPKLEDHLKAQYDYMKYICTTDSVNVQGEALQYYYGKKKINDMIQSFAESAFKPMIDYIVDALAEKTILAEVENPHSAGTYIHNVQGAVIANNTGSVQINQTINPDAEKLLQMIQAAVPILSDSGDTSETLESIKDDLDSITEQLQSEHPKKSRIKKALDGIKGFAGDVCSDTASTMLSAALIAAASQVDWNAMIQLGSNLLSQLH